MHYLTLCHSFKTKSILFWQITSHKHIFTYEHILIMHVCNISRIVEYSLIKSHHGYNFNITELSINHAFQFWFIRDNHSISRRTHTILYYLLKQCENIVYTISINLSAKTPCIYFRICTVFHLLHVKSARSHYQLE